MFSIVLTEIAEAQLSKLKKSPGQKKRHKAVSKTIRFLQNNPKHPGLQTHKFTSMTGENGETVFEAYAEQHTPAAYRIFWHYGPEKNQITIIAIVPHP